MNDKKAILKEMEKAIDDMDMAAFDRGLDMLSSLETQNIVAEEPRIFSARVQKLCQEDIQMESKPSWSRKKTRFIAVIAVASALLMGASVYAANNLNLFSFLSDDKYVTIRTTEDITEDEAKARAESDDTAPSAPENAVTPEQTEYQFESVEQARETMDMEIPFPADLPAMRFESGQGLSLALDTDGSEKRMVWLTYADDQQRMFGITVSRALFKPGVPHSSITTSDADPSSMGTYHSKSGFAYNTITESDDSGEKTAHIATTMIGEYDYALVFVGFEQAEREAIIDSVDLSGYQK